MSLQAPPDRGFFLTSQFRKYGEQARHTVVPCFTKIRAGSKGLAPGVNLAFLLSQVDPDP
jgi:hypothetical protein